MANLSPNLDQILQRAFQHHQAGQLPQAEALYRQILQEAPEHVEALQLAGVLAGQCHRLDEAEEFIRRVIALKPTLPEAHNNLGNVFNRKGQLDKAVTEYRQAIALKPNYPEAHNNLGIALRNLGLHEEAIAEHRQAIAQQPKFAEAHYNLGVALQDGGRTDESIASYREAIVLKPNYANAHLNLGNVLREKGQLNEAMAAYRRAVALNPQHAGALTNLGNMLRDLGSLDEAIAAHRAAIAAQPNYAEAHHNIGIALKERTHLDESIAASRQAIALQPAYADAYTNLGNALRDAGQPNEAIAAYRQALALSPASSGASGNLAYAMYFHPDYDAQTVAEELRRWNLQHAEPMKKHIHPHANAPDPERRLRIGYVSADFVGHASAHFLVPLFREHDRTQVEIFCYGQVAKSDQWTAWFQSACQGWRNTVGISDESLAAQIRRDGIDILVDLKLHTDRNRLMVFARKPAPMQVTWLGYPGTTGLTTIDYRLSDPYLDPPGADESVYSERTIRLPDCFWCYDPLEERDVPVNALPARERGVITFGCMNGLWKVHDALLARWAQVLRGVEGSRLVLLAPPGSHRQRTLDLLGREGIAPGRVEFLMRMSRREYMEQYQRIDVGLDSFPCNGHTTSLDSFWMGVPVVTQVGPTTMGRAGLSQLSNLGLAELAGQTAEEHVRIAVELARDLPRLEQLRATLRQRMATSPLMDGPRFARNIEAAYRQMWRTWCMSAC